jgi:hypothetical protein
MEGKSLLYRLYKKKNRVVLDRKASRKEETCRLTGVPRRKYLVIYLNQKSKGKKWTVLKGQ